MQGPKHHLKGIDGYICHISMQSQQFRSTAARHFSVVQIGTQERCVYEKTCPQDDAHRAFQRRNLLLGHCEWSCDWFSLPLDDEDVSQRLVSLIQTNSIRQGKQKGPIANFRHSDEKTRRKWEVAISLVMVECSVSNQLQISFSVYNFKVIRVLNCQKPVHDFGQSTHNHYLSSKSYL